MGDFLIYRIASYTGRQKDGKAHCAPFPLPCLDHAGALLSWHACSAGTGFLHIPLPEAGTKPLSCHSSALRKADCFDSRPFFFVIEETKIRFWERAFITALEWASEIIKIWPDGDLNSLPKEKIGEICGNDERWLDWKYFALTMAIAWKDDQPENLHPLTSSLVMGVVAPLPILVQPTHVRERDINFYISSAKFREIEDNFLKPMQ